MNNTKNNDFDKYKTIFIFSKSLKDTYLKQK